MFYGVVAVLALGPCQFDVVGFPRQSIHIENAGLQDPIFDEGMSYAHSCPMRNCGRRLQLHTAKKPGLTIAHQSEPMKQS